MYKNILFEPKTCLSAWNCVTFQIIYCKYGMNTENQRKLLWLVPCISFKRTKLTRNFHYINQVRRTFHIDQNIVVNVTELFHGNKDWQWLTLNIKWILWLLFIQYKELSMSLLKYCSHINKMLHLNWNQHFITVGIWG